MFRLADDVPRTMYRISQMAGILRVVIIGLFFCMEAFLCSEALPLLKPSNCLFVCFLLRCRCSRSPSQLLEPGAAPLLTSGFPTLVDLILQKFDDGPGGRLVSLYLQVG